MDWNAWEWANQLNQNWRQEGRDSAATVTTYE